MQDRLRLDAEREGLLGSLVRLTRCDDVSVVVARLPWRIRCIVSSDRNVRESQLVTFTSRRLDRRVDSSHVSRLALGLCSDLDRLNMTQPDGMVPRDPDLRRRKRRGRGLHGTRRYFRLRRRTQHSHC